MRTYVYTSITANYIPKARVLAQTLKQHNPSFTFVVFMTESVPPHVRDIEPCFDEVIPIADLEIERLPQWLFSHSVVEACTAIKGYALCSLLERPDCGEVFYLDPDIAVFDSLDELLAMFSAGSVLLTPHLLAPETTRATIEENEICSLQHGVYNLGFLGVRNDANGKRFARWWRDRLALYCYAEVSQGLFTDQKWMNLAPALFPFVHTIRDPGYNVATWNLSTRTLIGGFSTGFKVLVEEELGPGDSTVLEYPLRFYHFSGFDSGAQLAQLRRYGRGMPAAFLLRNWYIAECNKNIQEIYGSLSWEYSCYQNGQEITTEQRRLFRERADLQACFVDPFLTEQKGKNYYDWYFTHGINGG
ncbi:MAG TPA: glycosyltransferase [Ktedonobacterales bacterium]|nr:glycosyltransferase [Ktedonobacterales bacterium]